MEKADHTETCPDCGGTGRVNAPFSGLCSGVGMATGLIVVDTNTCDLCQGMGTVNCRADGSIIKR